MARKKSTKEYTLPEFRAWLEGIEELQPASWAPDATQWKVIREKLVNIKEEVIEVEIPVPTPAPLAVQPNGPVPRPPPFQPNQQFSPSELISNLDQQVEMTPAAKSALSGKLPSPQEVQPAVSVSTDAGKIKTPHVDTSDGDYNSTFG